MCGLVSTVKVGKQFEFEHVSLNSISECKYGIFYRLDKKTHFETETGKLKIDF